MRLTILSVFLCTLAASSAVADDTVRIAGSAFLVQPFITAAPVLGKENIELKIANDANSPIAIAAVGIGQIDLAVSTRTLQPAERATYPDRPMPEVTIGYQALALSVSNEVWFGGVRTISKADMIRIYEGEAKNWKEFGGPNRPIKFYNPEQGKGVWEFFVTWLYGDMRKAPLGKGFETAATPEEAQNLVEFNSGALAVLSPDRAETKGTHALALREENGRTLLPTRANVRNSSWPISRPIVVISAWRPTGNVRKTVEFMLSPAGQEIIRQSEMISVTPGATE